MARRHRMIDLDGIEALLKRRDNPGGTHYENCYLNHPLCAAWAMLDELSRARLALTAILDHPPGSAHRIATMALSDDTNVSDPS